jgi:hypothetical protein
MMRMVWEKHQVAESVTTPYVPKISLLLKSIEKEAFHLTAAVSHEGEVRIIDGVWGEFMVRFSPHWFCSCGDFQDNLIPCKHAWRAMTRLKICHLDYVSPYYSSEKFRSVYSYSIPAILSIDLRPNKYCGEPQRRRQAGRPSQKQRTRFAEEDPMRNTRKCSWCKAVGHDRRTCELHRAYLSGAVARHNAEVEVELSDPTDQFTNEEIDQSTNEDVDESGDDDNDQSTNDNFAESVPREIIDIAPSQFLDSECSQANQGQFSDFLASVLAEIILKNVCEICIICATNILHILHLKVFVAFFLYHCLDFYV